MKKLLVLISAMLCIMLLAFSASAEENVVYVASGGTGDGSTVESPLGTLIDAFTAVGESGGTVVLTSDLTIGATVNLPDHTGKVTLTSIYGGVDYRATNDAALRYTASARLVLGGPTEIDYFDIEIDSGANGGAVIAADFNDLKIGYNVDISYNYTVSGVKMYVIGGPNNDKTGNTLDEGESCTIEIYSGAYEQVDAFSRSVANMAHYGTVYMTLGGNASARLCYMGAITTGATGGSCELTLKENSKATWLYLSGNAGGMNGSVTVNVKDKATVTSIDRYADSLFPNGTKTINLYGDSYTVPANLENYFTTVNVIEDEVVEPEVPVELDVVYLAANGTGDGSSAEVPVGTLVDAVTALGDNGGTVVLMSDFTVSALTTLPSHSGTVTITSLYNGVDYRTTNDAALRYTKTARIVLGGDTIIDDLNIEIDSTANDGAVIAANFHDLKIGYGAEVIHNYTPSFPSRMFIIGGSNNDTNGNGLAAGEVSNVEIYSGDYMQVTAFSRGTANKAHYGTVNLTVGGDVTVYETYLGAVTTGATGGTVNLELIENAKLNGTGLFLSGNSGGMNGDVTVNIRDNAEITSFSRYAANLHAGTKTINVYGEDVSLPTSLDTYFDVVNIYVPKDTVTITENIDISKVASVSADGVIIDATFTNTDGGIAIEYTEDLGNFELSIAVKENGYTVYTYTVTETNDTAAAVFLKTNTYAGNVIYIGAANGNGLTPETPVSSFAKAYDMLIGNSGTFVVVGKVSMDTAIIAPEHDGLLTVTSVFDGVDYRTNGAELYYPSSTGWTLGGETQFENLTFNIDTTAVISAAFNPLIFDEGIEVINDYSADEGNGLYLIGAHNKSTNYLTEFTEDTSVTVRSGHFYCIVGFSRHSGARVHTGTSYINVEDEAYVRYVFGGSNQSGSTAKNSIITVKDKAIVENIYAGGSASNNYITGEVIIDVTELDGGDIYEFDTISIDTSSGKVKVLYDPRTVADGIVTMAEMAQFDVLSTCDITGAHTFGETYNNPFGGGLTAHTCEICNYTCLIEAAPEKVADGVVFVADGGFGNGLNPVHPFGNLEDAFTALGNSGGTIVLVGECTLPINLEWKFGASHVSFQEPTHTGEVLVTSVYGGVDYRENGAKLIFNGDMHYRLSGPTTFDHIVFDTVDNAKMTNLVAARYNPLVFGEDCKMNKTSADGYQFWIVGGYQYFRYTDFIGVEIEDRFLDMVTPARQKAWDWQPDDLVEFTYTSGSGNTHNIILQKDAAEAFQKMFADMGKEGLYVPYPSWRFRSAHTQYGIFSDSVGDMRANGKTFAEAYLGVAKSASPAGSSEHQLGLAFDIEDERLQELYPGNAHGKYDTTAEWQWIVDNGYKYGIIHRFLKNKSNVTGFVYEAWHFRYVGVEHAMAIAETDGYCLEEYVGQTIGLFDQNSSVTILSGDFYQVMGGSRGCDNLTFTGTNHVTVGENANVTNLVDVDGEVGEVIKPTMGDATGDEIVNLVDAIRVFKYVVDNTVKINTAAADINGDKVVDIKDALLILKATVNN